MRNKTIIALLALSTSVISLCGCNANSNNNDEEYVTTSFIANPVETSPVVIESVTHTTTVEPDINDTYIVYDVQTHYIHNSDCELINRKDNDYVEIDNTDYIKCRRCEKCNPDIEIKMYYEP